MNHSPLELLLRAVPDTAPAGLIIRSLIAVGAVATGLLANGCSGGAGGTSNSRITAVDKMAAISAAAAARASETFVSSVSDSVEEIPAYRYKVDTIAQGLEVPWSGALLSNGDLLVTEREGRVRLVRGAVWRGSSAAAANVAANSALASIGVPGFSTVAAETVATIPVRFNDPDWKPESGLMGMTVVHTGRDEERILVLATTDIQATNAFTRLMRGIGNRIKSRTGAAVFLSLNSLLEIDFDSSGTPDASSSENTAPKQLFTRIPSNRYHAGGALRTGPDGMLYITAGDGTEPAAAQKPGMLAGKILRLHISGAIPSDNPFPGSPVWALGIRNSQGMAWHAPSGTMFAVDHGPTGMSPEQGRMGNDELNVIVGGGNYGWPVEGGEWGEREHIQPLYLWAESIAPSGLAALPTLARDSATLVVSALRDQSLRWLTLVRSGSSWSVVAEAVMLRGTHGRLRLLTVAPDGSIFVGTSNRDGRGSPSELDDLVLRLLPRALPR